MPAAAHPRTAAHGGTPAGRRRLQHRGLRFPRKDSSLARPVLPRSAKVLLALLPGHHNRTSRDTASAASTPSACRSSSGGQRCCSAPQVGPDQDGSSAAAAAARHTHTTVSTPPPGLTHVSPALLVPGHHASLGQHHLPWAAIRAAFSSADLRSIMEKRDAVSTGRALPKGLALGLLAGGGPGKKGTHAGGTLTPLTDAPPVSFAGGNTNASAPHPLQTNVGGSPARMS